MKWAVLIGDGMADRPLEALGGRTVLQVARTTWMDTVVRMGLIGLVHTIPHGCPPGSDIATMVIMGYDPKRDYSGRGPLEAAAMGVDLAPEDVAFRCNLVHLDCSGEEPVMKDFTAGHIPTERAREIVQALDEAVDDPGIRFYPGVSYRHLMVWSHGKEAMETTPPHDITGRPIGPYLPKGEGAERVRSWMEFSRSFFKRREIQRLIPPDNPCPPNSIWLWGQGKRPSMRPITEIYGLRGGIITAVDLLRGIGITGGLEVIHVPGATGYYDTDYAGKGRHAIEALREGLDFVIVHVEAPDEAGHEGNIEEKIRAIESFDREVVGRVLKGLQEMGQWGVLVLPDHATPISVRTHTEEPVPFAVAYDHNRFVGAGERFDEGEAASGGIMLEDGTTLLERFIKAQWG
jgi:2,3-bisphosphoglycerate-independent phosphoglycerate mutase